LQRFYILVALIVLIGGVLLGIAKLLWGLSAKWTTAVHSLTDLGEDIKELITQKEIEHRRLEGTDTALTKRIDRHEQWHHDETMSRRKQGGRPSVG